MFILVALSFAMAVIGFIFYSLYEAVWWVAATKRAPRITHIPALSICAALVWLLWKWC